MNEIDAGMKSSAACTVCKGGHVRNHETHKEKHHGHAGVNPSGICTGCQAKIAAIIIVVMVVLAGMIFFGVI